MGSQMDRPFYYTGYVLRTLDLLNASKMSMVGLGRLMLDLFGPGTYVGGLPLTATSPASMAVLAGPGAIYALENVDNTAYSLIPADTTNQIVKQGILMQPGATMATPAPVTTGQSINYLIQGTYQDSDTTGVVLPYFNSANPATPFTGPGNTGASQATIRSGQFIVAAKAGIPASTGSQTTPAPDSGFVGLYVVTVPFGATTVTAANISTLSGAPFISTQLTGVLAAIQAQAGNYVVDTGSANTYAATLSPAPASLFAGLTVRIKIAHTNTSSSTLNLNGLGAKSIVHRDGSAMMGSDLLAGQIATLAYDGSNFQLVGEQGRLINVQIFAASATYTPHAGMLTAVVEVQGGGSAGYGSAATGSGQGSVGSPGVSGSYCKSRIAAANIGASQVVTVGAGGVGVSGAAGGVGGTSSFGALLSAPGGSGGTIVGPGAPPFSAGGGYATAASGGFMFAMTGAVGAPSLMITAGIGFGGPGGQSFFGPGAPAIAGGSAGTPAVNYGAGGSGTANPQSSSAIAGGNGMQGFVIIWEFA